MSFSKRLKATRATKGLSQAQLGRIIGVRKATVCVWESGSSKPSGENLIACAIALNSNIYWLMHGKIKKSKVLELPKE